MNRKGGGLLNFSSTSGRRRKGNICLSVLNVLYILLCAILLNPTFLSSLLEETRAERGIT